MSIVKLLTPKRARKQDRRDNADYAVRQLTAIRATIDEFKLEGETDAMCVKRIVAEWKHLNEIYNLPTQRARTEATVETEQESGLPNFPIL